MERKLAKLFKEAYKEAGLELPLPTPRPPKPFKENKGNKLSRKIVNTLKKTRQRSIVHVEKTEKQVDTSVYTTGLIGSANISQHNLPSDHVPDYHLILQPKSSAQMLTSFNIGLGQHIQTHFDGRCCMLIGEPADFPDLELKLGLDFGTSSTKIVIADKQQNIAFAVPFKNNSGVSRYLLPGVLFKEKEYNLDGLGSAYRDLKLGLLDEAVPEEAMLNATAFLALAIRHARGWLFTEHKSLYDRATIAWTLCIGMPSENPNDKRLKPRFELLGLAAWQAASLSYPLTDSVLKNCLLDAGSLLAGNPQAPQIDLEIRAIPELAAQVHGHVSSESFDPLGRNIFMIVDIGAGTVDSCLFHVHKDNKTKRWNFLMFTKAVESNGSVNLHRNRLSWWDQAIRRFYPARTDLLSKISESLLITDCLSVIPENINDYFLPAKLSFDSDDIHPDRLFLKQVKEQVLKRTYADARTQQHLSDNDLVDMPMFLCGGGMRMPFYSRLRDELVKPAPNARWLRAKNMSLSQPQKIRAPGLPTEDYDRLSVAYGLGMMEFGTLEQSMRISIPSQQARLSSENSYIGKEMM